MKDILFSRDVYWYGGFFYKWRCRFFYGFMFFGFRILILIFVLV